MGERIAVATCFIYEPEVRKVVRAVLQAAGLLLPEEVAFAPEDPDLKDIGPLYGFCKPGHTPGLELEEFVGWDEAVLDQLDGTTAPGVRFRWWLVLIGDSGDYVHCYRFGNGTHSKVVLKAHNDHIVTEQEET